MDIKNKLAWVLSLVLVIMASASLSVMAAIQLGAETVTFTQPIVISAPTLSTHAATKQYVDSAVAGTTQGTVTSITAGSGLSGGTITTSGTIAVDSTVLRTTGNHTITGKIYPASTSNRRAGMYGYYDSYKIGHIWSMGTAYVIPEDGSNFGNLYGLAYKHTNNTTGGTMAGGHQMVWVQNGTGTSAIGTGIWTSGTGTFGGTVSVATPTASTHATTKAYVDSMFSGSGPWTLSGSSVYVTNTSHNVGIGTTSPSAKLHVLGADTDNANLVTILSNSDYRGTFAIRNGVSNNPSFLLGTTGASEPLAIMTEGIEKMRINANGNVGINTTSPGYKLTVNGTIGTSDMNNPYLVLDSSSAGGNAAEQSAQISLGESGRGSASLHLAYTGDGFSYIGMGTLTNNVPQYYAMKMYYQNNNIYFPGSVGVGQSSPGYKLDVSGTGRFTGAVIVGTPTASTHATTKAYVDSMFSGSGPWTLSGSNVYVTTTTNNVGIGTTSPGARLQILDGTIDKAAYQFKSSSTSAYTTSFNMDDVGLDIGHNSSSRSLNFLTANLDRMTITGDGKVGIGTTSPTGMLHIYNANGTIIRAAGATNIANAGGIDFTEGGNMGASNGYGVRMLYNGADNKFYIKTGVAETITDRITILRDNGYVGIGTTTPGYLLDVYGTLRVAGALTGGSTASFSSTVSVATPTAASHATTKSYVDTAVTNAIAGLTVTLYDVASGTTGTAVCDAQNAICLDVVATDTNPSLSYSCLWTTTSSTLKARCLK